MIGLINYYGIGHSYGEVLALDRWIRHRVRLCYWKMWKRPRKRRKMLLRLGIDPEEVHLATDPYGRCGGGTRESLAPTRFA